MPTASTAPKDSPAKDKSPSRAATPSGTMASTTSSVQRTRSIRGSPLQSRASVRGRGAGALGRAGRGASDDDTKAETASLIEDLRAQLRTAETVSDEHQKQLFILQSKLDEAQTGHAKAEDTANEHVERIEALTKENQDATRKHKELENIYEGEKAASMREREEALGREEELQAIVQRLKDSLKDPKKNSGDGEGLLSRAASLRGRSSPGKEPGSPSLQARDSSQNSSKLVLQKDKVIESLRLELAESQIRLVEMENKGGGRLQELERHLMDARISNAKLMEDNESYQVLLSEKTLNGDFSKSGFLEPPRSPSARPSSGPHGGSSLADELESVSEENLPEQDDRARKLEAELGAQKDQNKALTLYINKIISRLLASEQFETLFQDGVVSHGNPLTDVTPATPIDFKNKDLPLPPPDVPGKENAAPSLLQRAGSLFGGSRKQRPLSLTNRAQAQAESGITPPATGVPDNMLSPPAQDTIHVQKRLSATLNENPDTAPSLPIRRSHSNRGGGPAARGHRRSNSDWSASIVNNMYRGPPGGGPVSPGFASPRQSMFASPPPPPLILEDAEKKELDDDIGDTRPSRSSETASDSGYADSVAGSERPSSPRSAAAAALEGRSVSGSAAPSVASETSKERSWFSSGQAPPAPAKGGGMRPLRLVQERVQAEEAALAEQKKANRGSSFMGWFNKGAAQGEGTTPPAVADSRASSAQASRQESVVSRTNSQGESP
ncbi:hypothetical protein FH972_023061 [Carpinus fangiana]|uniref:M protein, serotype 2.1 n=1 Tax=Carpinus fangiana TaxID=176857 RepID=A0A5N6KU32_9ROSI|nr:hypothetical protein FH972_023061 [Carpinus fangiana]